MKKCIVLLLVLLVATIANAATVVQSGNWDDTATWDTGAVPTSADNVAFPGGFDLTVKTGTTAECAELANRGWIGGLQTITIEDDAQFDPFYFYPGWDATTTIYNSGNIYAGAEFGIGYYGPTTMYMDGGRVDSTWVSIGFAGAYTTTLYLSGGTVQGHSGFRMGEDLGYGHSGVVEISGTGELIVPGTHFDTSFTAGTIRAADGLTLQFDPFSMPDYTIISVPEPATIALLSIGSFVAIRRKRS